ncbi:hypothetical protein K8R30_02555 [archaeon]|nr:hypothetical protein [archaeon]
MDFQSIKSYEGQPVKLTLVNNFWYRCKILSVSKTSVEAIEENGKKLTVTPEAVLMIIGGGA